MDAIQTAEKERLERMTDAERREMYNRYAADREAYRFSRETYEQWLSRKLGLPQQRITAHCRERGAIGIFEPRSFYLEPIGPESHEDCWFHMYSHAWELHHFA